MNKMLEQLKTITEDNVDYTIKVEEKDKICILLQGPNRFVYETIRQLEQPVDKDKTVYQVVSDDEIMVFFLTYNPCMEISEDEVDALLSDPVYNFSSSYRYNSTDSTVTISAKSLDREHLYKKFEPLFSLTETIITDIIYDGEWAITVGFREEQLDNLGKFRARKLLTNYIPMTCPKCEHFMSFLLNEFRCYSCLSCYKHPEIVDGLSSTATPEEIETEIRERFSEELLTSNRQLLETIYGFYGVAELPPILMKPIKVPLLGAERNESIGLTSEFPPVLLNSTNELHIEPDTNPEKDTSSELTTYKVPYCFTQKDEKYIAVDLEVSTITKSELEILTNLLDVSTKVDHTLTPS